jgi:hypothetical protein
MTTHIHKIKCMRCSLHFAAYSHKADWEPTACPECGMSGPFMRWYETSSDFIFQHVPGTADLVALG